MNSSFSSLLVLVCAVSASFFAPVLRAAPGDVDGTFNPNANNYVYCSAVQADGKILIGGAFTSLQPNGAASAASRNYVARLNSDGSLDTTFNPNANNSVLSVAVQPDGKILVGGGFTTLQPNGATTATTRNYVARLNSDGSLDATFNPNANSSVYSLTVQPDGKIVLGGNFTTLQPNGATTATARSFVARLNTDGSLDTTFYPNPNSTVYGLTMQADGRFLVGGAFTTLQPNGAVSATTRNYVARLNTDGSLDTTFNPNAGNYVYCSAVQADGKIVLGGAFTTLQPNGAASATSRSYLARLNTNGSLDTTFNPSPDNYVYSLVVQADGKILLGGTFYSLQPVAGYAYTRRGFARVNSDGSLDGTFTTYVSAYLYSTMEQADGKILVGGQFTNLQIIGSGNTVPRNNVARLANDAALQKILVTNQSGSTGTVQLVRSGALPETQLVTFETSTDAGATWTNLTTASRITNGWQVSGYSLGGTTGLIRARFRNSGGRYGGSSGLLEVIAPFPTPDIIVEQPTYTPLTSNSSTVDYGTLPLSQTTSRTFLVRNNGPGVLNLGAVTVDGANAGDFVVGTSLTNASVASGGSTTFTVAFAPVSTTASSYRSATLHVASNANGTNAPFNITLGVLGLSTTASTGSDGLNDYAKYQLAALGFDWQQSQPALVQTLYSGANSAGLYTTDQVQALNVGTPLIQRDASTGQFKLTIALQQSADLRTYTSLSLSTGSTMINSAGALEFRFNGPSGAQFYRLQSQ